MNSLRTLLLFVSVCLGLACPVYAQTSTSQIPRAVLRFLFLDESPGSYSVKNPQGYTDLGATPYVVSAPQTFTPGDRIELFKELRDPTTGLPVRTRVLARQVPATSHALIVITPSTPSADGTRDYQSRLFETDPAKTPPRSVRILNLGTQPVSARFGSRITDIAPGESNLLVPDLDSRGRSRAFVALRDPQAPKMLFNSFISFPDGRRMTGIIVHSPSGLRHTYTQDELTTMAPPRAGHFWLSFTDPAAAPQS